jgi:fatty aldehyde-generating acyl-ACP reductase
MLPIDFALLGHPASLQHVLNLLPHLRPELEAQAATASDTEIAAGFEQLPPFVIDDTLTLTRPDGTLVHGRLIICTFLPETTQTPGQLSAAAQKTRAGMQLAKDLGAKIAGLGGFTSIVGGAQGNRLPQAVGLAATSGNGLTAALAIVQIKDLFAKLNTSTASRTAAVLGATGDIGRACTLALINDLNVNRLILIARNQNKLQALQTEVQSINKALNISISSDAKDAAHADLILAATSAPGPLLSEDDLNPGTVVCDVGYPHTVAYAATPRPDVLIFHGGIATSPGPLPITHFTQLPADNLLHGCFAETMVLALAGRYENYSIGQGNITAERMQAIYDLACTHGFGPAPLYKNNHRVTDEGLEVFESRQVDR